jgi:hypothetical protein
MPARPITTQQFTESLQSDRDMACEDAERALDRLISECQDAKEALRAAQAGEPFRHSDLDTYGNALCEVPKACMKAYTLVQMAARATRMEV